MAALYCHNWPRRRRDLTHNYTLYWLLSHFILSKVPPTHIWKLSLMSTHISLLLSTTHFLRDMQYACSIENQKMWTGKFVHRTVLTLVTRLKVRYTILLRYFTFQNLFLLQECPLCPMTIIWNTNDKSIQLTVSYFTLGIYRHFYRTVIAYF